MQKRVVFSGLSLVSAIGALLLPKCPICLAGYLAVFGLGTGAASVLSPMLRPIALGLMAITLVLLVIKRSAKRAAVSSASKETHGNERECGSACHPSSLRKAIRPEAPRPPR